MTEPMPIYGFRGPTRFLSNFYPVPHGVFFAGLAYPTVEHAYQAGKTEDDELRRVIHAAATPGEAKALGREVKSGLRRDWNTYRVIHMEALLRGKFKPGTQLAHQLIATYPAKIVEANTWGDTFWGKCNGKGRNVLGLFLMEIRDDLRLNYITGKTTHG